PRSPRDAPPRPTPPLFPYTTLFRSARALAPEPAVLLLDEPFSNLDPTLRNQLRSEVRTLLAGLGVTAVFVTHDQEEAFVVGDERSEEHTSELQSRENLVCRLLLEKT